MRKQNGLPLAILIIALGVPSFAQKAAETEVTVTEGAPLTVACALGVAERAAWRLDGAAPPPDMRAAGEGAAPGGLTARLAAPAARPQHAGLYTCASPPRAAVRVHVLPARSALVLAPGETSTEAAAAAGAGAAGGADAVLLVYNVSSSVSLNCSGAGAPYVWRKNDTALEQLPELRDRFALDEGGAVLRLPRASEDDFGEYSCASAGAPPAARWALRARPVAKLAADTSVVERQRLKLVCRLVGKPYPAVVWWRSNSSDERGERLAAREGLALSASEQGVAGAVLELREAAREDAGLYTCAPEGGLPATTTLRVKDMYAALWPFLGICAEVFVLCAVILVYEKRRTKPELDDSDTDNHDQKKS